MQGLLTQLDCFRMRFLEQLHPARPGLVLRLQRIIPDGEARGPFDPRLAMRESALAALLETLQRRFEVVSLQELIEPQASRSSQERLAITFDHGWAENFSIAFPLLRQFKLPALIFLCTSFVGTTEQLPEERFARLWQTCVLRREQRWLEEDLAKWNGINTGALSPGGWAQRFRRMPIDLKLLMLSHLERVYKASALPLNRHFLTWNEVRHMADQGIAFGSHTERHVSLPSETRSVAMRELTGSREKIRQNLGSEVSFLAYPNGACNSDVFAMAHEAGYLHAFTDGPRWTDGSCEPLAMPRVSCSWSSLAGRSFRQSADPVPVW